MAVYELRKDLFKQGLGNLERGVGENMEKCKTCKRRIGNRCAAMKEFWEGCWAWTDNPDWQEEYLTALDKYRRGEFGVSK